MKAIIPAMAMTLALGLASPAFAADGLNGASMSLFWSIPFAGMLLSIALGPLLFADIWHHHYGKISAFWAALILLPMLFMHGAGTTAAIVFHTAALEYIPFMARLCSIPACWPLALALRA